MAAWAVSAERQRTTTGRQVLLLGAPAAGAPGCVVPGSAAAVCCSAACAAATAATCAAATAATRHAVLGCEARAIARLTLSSRLLARWSPLCRRRVVAFSPSPHSPSALARPSASPTPHFPCHSPQPPFLTPSLVLARSLARSFLACVRLPRRWPPCVVLPLPLLTRVCAANVRHFGYASRSAPCTSSPSLPSSLNPILSLTFSYFQRSVSPGAHSEACSRALSPLFLSCLTCTEAIVRWLFACIPAPSSLPPYHLFSGPCHSPPTCPYHAYRSTFRRLPPSATRCCETRMASGDPTMTASARSTSPLCICRTRPSKVAT
jgi:hypothetical protein